MQSSRGYNGYYESGSAARKFDYKEVNKSNKQPKVKKRVVTKAKPKAKRRASGIICIITIFVMTMIIVYRFNVISEKNLLTQSLKNELTKAESALLSSQIDVEQGTDLNQIEAYAKQKLGMQKPDKNQTVYVDTSKTGSKVEVKDNKSLLQKVIDSIKDTFSKIF